MMKIKIFNLGWDVILMRYFLMMFLVITGVLTKIWFIAFLGFPVFLTAILAISFETKQNEVFNAKMVSLKKLAKEDKKIS